MLKNLKALRESAHLSQSQLGEIIGMSQQSINRYENHPTEPDIKTLSLLADYFETSIDYLVGHTDIRRKIEPIQPYDLNEREGVLVENFRLLTETQRQSMELVMKGFLDPNGNNK